MSTLAIPGVKMCSHFFSLRAWMGDSVGELYHTGSLSANARSTGEEAADGSFRGVSPTPGSEVVSQPSLKVI